LHFQGQKYTLVTLFLRLYGTLQDKGLAKGNGMNQQPGQYTVRPGPEAFLPPSAASMGNALPDPGQAHINGRIVPE